jgi:hypothetical protein
MASREIRPGQISSTNMGLYADWAVGHLLYSPGGQADPDLCRQSYLMWASDQIKKPEPRSKQRGVVKAIGGKPKGVGKNLVYLDVVLVPLVSPGPRVPPPVVAAGIVALRDAGVITGEQALKAAMDLA